MANCDNNMALNHCLGWFDAMVAALAHIFICCAQFFAIPVLCISVASMPAFSQLELIQNSNSLLEAMRIQMKVFSSLALHCVDDSGRGFPHRTIGQHVAFNNTCCYERALFVFCYGSPAYRTYWAFVCHTP